MVTRFSCIDGANVVHFAFQECRSMKCKGLSDSDIEHHTTKCCRTFFESRIAGWYNGEYTCPIYIKFTFGKKLLTKYPIDLVGIENGLVNREDYTIKVSCMRDCPLCMKSKCENIGLFSPLNFHTMFRAIDEHIFLHSVIGDVITLEEEVKKDNVYDIEHNGDGTFKCLSGFPCGIKHMSIFEEHTDSDSDDDYSDSSDSSSEDEASDDDSIDKCNKQMTISEARKHHKYAVKIKQFVTTLTSDPMKDIEYINGGLFKCIKGSKCVFPLCKNGNKGKIPFQWAQNHHMMYMMIYRYAEILAKSTHGRIGCDSPCGIVDIDTFKCIISLTHT